MSGAEPRAVLFDAAGTLIRLREPVGRTYARVARAHAARADPDRLARAFSLALASAPAMVFPDAPASEIAARERAWWRDRVRETFDAAQVSPPDFEACFESLWRAFSGSDTWRASPDAGACLARLHERGLSLAVVSNFDHRLPGLLEQLGLAAWLDAVVLPGEARVAKPDPAIFRFALARLGRSAAESAVVGDDPERDLAPARAAGLRAIDVRELATLADLPARLADLPAASRDERSRP